MDADFSVELGADDPVLDFPWEAAGTPLRYYDLKRQPELLPFVDEAQQFHELHAFLASANSQASMMETAKCDTWWERELNEAEAIYDAELKFVSYIDLVMSDETSTRTNFEFHEKLARRLVELLGRAPQIKSAAEFVIRRCYFRGSGEPESGYYITFYLSGYGVDESEARRRWGIGLNVVQNAILQMSAEIRRATIAG